MSDTAAAEDWRELYAEAFRRFGPAALWNHRQHLDPTPIQALGAGYSLRQEGDMEARRLAERLERAVHGSD